MLTPANATSQLCSSCAADASVLRLISPQTWPWLGPDVLASCLDLRSASSLQPSWMITRLRLTLTTFPGFDHEPDLPFHILGPQWWGHCLRLPFCHTMLLTHFSLWGSNPYCSLTLASKSPNWGKFALLMCRVVILFFALLPSLRILNWSLQPRLPPTYDPRHCLQDSKCANT